MNSQDINLIETTLKENYVFKGKIINVRQDVVTLPNGNTSIREIVEHKGGVGILAIDSSDNVYLVEQFRYAYKKTLLEIPAGKIELDEEPEVCGIRELREETGITADSFTFLNKYYPSVGFSNEIIYIYLAKDLTVAQTQFDEDEFLNVKKIPYQTALQMVMDGSIKDSKTIIALLTYNATKK